MSVPFNECSGPRLSFQKPRKTQVAKTHQTVRDPKDFHIPSLQTEGNEWSDSDDEGTQLHREEEIRNQLMSVPFDECSFWEISPCKDKKKKKL